MTRQDTDPSAWNKADILDNLARIRAEAVKDLGPVLSEVESRSGAPGSDTAEGRGSESAPPARDPTQPLLLGLAPAGPIPETVGELLAVLNRPRSVQEALGALAKLGELTGRDVIEDNSTPDLGDFHPLVLHAIGGEPEAVRSFVLFAIPLRRRLARHYRVRAPDVGMMVDVLVLSYWRVIEAERVAVIALAKALEDPGCLARANTAERIKDLATRQMIRLIDALGVATGRRLDLDPDADAARLLRFPEASESHRERLRRASAG